MKSNTVLYQNALLGSSIILFILRMLIRDGLYQIAVEQLMPQLGFPVFLFLIQQNTDNSILKKLLSIVFSYFSIYLPVFVCDLAMSNCKVSMAHMALMLCLFLSGLLVMEISSVFISEGASAAVAVLLFVIYAQVMGYNRLSVQEYAVQIFILAIIVYLVICIFRKVFPYAFQTYK